MIPATDKHRQRYREIQRQTDGQRRTQTQLETGRETDRERETVVNRLCNVVQLTTQSKHLTVLFVGTPSQRLIVQQRIITDNYLCLHTNSTHANTRVLRGSCVACKKRR